MALRLADILLYAGPRFPSLREEVKRLKEKRAESEARRRRKVEPMQIRYLTTTQLTGLSPDPWARVWNLDKIAKEWSGGKGEFRPAALKNHITSTKEVDVLPLVANIEPGSHLSSPKIRSGRLPFPVLIPEREAVAHGVSFVDVYPPVLEDCFIGRNAFGRFMSGLHQVLQTNRDEGGLSLSAIEHNACLREFVQEANHQVFQRKGLQFRMIKFVSNGLGHAASCFDMMESGDAKHVMDVLQIEECDGLLTGMAADFIFAGLERAAVSATQGDDKELQALFDLYGEQKQTLDGYFCKRLNAQQQGLFDLPRTPFDGIRPQSERRSGMFQHYKQAPVRHHIKFDIVHVLFTSSKAQEW